MGTILAFLLSLARGMFRSRADLALENAALRQQLGTYLRCGKRPKLRPTDRALWVALRRVWPKWQSSLAFVRPDTVIGWHRQGFRLYWRWKSRRRKAGQPPIPRAHLELIKRMSRENPGWGEDRIAEELRLKPGTEHSTSTVRKYMKRRPSSDGGRSWRRFVTNHSREVFASDFLVQYTARLEVVYVFVVMEVASRRVALINAIRAPTLDWVKRQIRDLAEFGVGPRYLVHDNDGIFGQFGTRNAKEALSVSPRLAVAGNDGHPRGADAVPCAKCERLRGTVQQDAARGGVEPLHLLQRGPHQTRVPGVRRVLQSSSTVPSHWKNPGSIS